MSPLGLPDSAFEGQHCIVIADVDERRYTSAATIQTIGYLLGVARAEHVTVLPARFDCTSSKGSTLSLGAIALGSALHPAWAAKISLPLNAQGIAAATPSLSSYILVNDTHEGHPAVAQCIRYLKKEKNLDCRATATGFAFAQLESRIWPVAKKRIFVITDAMLLAASEAPHVWNRKLALAQRTIRGLLERGATRLIVGAIVPKSCDEATVRRHLQVPETAVEVLLLPEDASAENLAGVDAQLRDAHVYVNDLAHVSSVYTDHFVDREIRGQELRKAAIGVLRQAAISSAFRLARDIIYSSNPQEGFSIPTRECALIPRHVEQIYPVKWTRVLYLVDAGAVTSCGSAASEPQRVLSRDTITKLAAAGAIVTVFPVAASSATQQQLAHDEQLPILITGAVKFLTASDITQQQQPSQQRRRQGAGDVSQVPLTLAGQLGVLAKLAESSDVVVNDLSLRAVNDDRIKSVLADAQEWKQKVAVGDVCLLMGMPLPAAVIASMEPTSPVRRQQHEQKISQTLAALGGQPSAATTRRDQRDDRGAGGDDASAQTRLLRAISAEKNFRKPVFYAEGSLLGSLVASLATTVLLHPLQLYIQPQPTCFSNSTFLLLRALHSIAREVAFHVASGRRQSGVAGEKMPGFAAAALSTVLTEPLRAIAAGVPPTQSLHAAGLMLSPVMMSSAPHATNALARLLQERLGLKSPSPTPTALLLQAVSRILVGVLMVRVEMTRQSYFGARAAPPRLVDSSQVLQVYLLKQLLSLLIETFVQKYFR